MSETFTYHGVELPYFWHLYNLTMMNERAVEIAIAHHWLDNPVGRDDGGHGLEVGNVLGHYAHRFHTVIDRDEPAEWYQRDQWVINADILDLQWPDGPKTFPWVLSISTVEHTEDPVKAIEVLKDLVAPGGKLLVTFPMGVRGELDDFAFDESRGQQTFTQYCTIERDRVHDSWVETPSGVSFREYGPWANSVFIGEWERPA
jgi:SAM-dependent methyltransferase